MAARRCELLTGGGHEQLGAAPTPGTQVTTAPGGGKEWLDELVGLSLRA